MNKDHCEGVVTHGFAIMGIINVSFLDALFTLGIVFSIGLHEVLSPQQAPMVCVLLSLCKLNYNSSFVNSKASMRA